MLILKRQSAWTAISHLVSSNLPSSDSPWTPFRGHPRLLRLDGLVRRRIESMCVGAKVEKRRLKNVGVASPVW
jgi:hypothetical protein